MLVVEQSTPLKEALLTCRLMVRYILVFGCIINLLLMTTSLYSLQVLDRVLSSGNLNTLTMLSIVMILALILLGLVRGARSFAMNKMGLWFEKKLSHVVFENAIKTAMESRANANSQQLRDLQTIKTYITSPSLLSIMDVPWALIFLIMLFFLHVYIGSLVLVGGIILVGVGLVADRSTKKLVESNNENFIRSMRNVEQSTRNAEVIEVMGFKGNVINSWQKLNHKVQHTQSLQVERQAIFTEIISVIRTVIQISVTGLGAYIIISTQGAEFSSGCIIASSTLAGRALAPLEHAVASWKGYINSSKAYNRLNSMFIRTVKEEDLMSLPAPEGRVEVENIYFAPPGSTKHIIKGITFALRAGETLAIIGASASGKTTLAKLIAGVWNPNIGSVRVDGASLKDWRRSDLGKYIGYLPQGVELFGGTVRENISRMDPNANSEDVIMAAQLAGVHDLILQLPKAYDTEIGVDGSVLSGGQKQRIALARAFFGHPKLLILDEPNASLDVSGEAALSGAIEVAKEQCITAILISHRTSILALADTIMVLQNGSVVAYGARDKILAQLSGKLNEQLPKISGSV